MEEKIKEENNSKNSVEEILAEEQEKSSIEKEDNQNNIYQNENNLEEINENYEDNNYSANKETEIKELLDSFQKDPHELISNLLQKISNLEGQVNNLREKNDELTKNNIENDTKLKTMSYVGTRKKFILGNNDNNNIEFAELLKEKNDLQEINENMLNMLTEKELENEELQENFENYKNEMKIEIQQYLKTIDELEEKISQNNQKKRKF